MPRVKRKWTPHPKQAEILNDDHRFRVVPAGRRFGKTFMARNEAFEYSFENPDSYVWYVAPTDEDARELAFEPLKKAIPRELMAQDPKKSSPREIYLVNGSRIQFRSAASQSRGRGLDHVVIEEAGEMPNGYWSGVVRPSLSDTLGTALMIGTPKGRNWFFHAYEKGNDPEYAEWNSWTATTYDNPHVADSEVEAAKREMPETTFRQEYLAEFAESEGQVFPEPNGCTLPYALGSATGSPPYTTGVDLARTNNYLAVCTLDSDGMLVGYRRDRGGSWASAGRTLEQYLADYPGVCYLDATRDNKIIEDLGKTVRDVQVEPVRFTPSEKQNMVENLAARLETGDIVLPADGSVDQLMSELRVFEYETTQAGNIRYGAPEGMNDDTVDALALAARESKVAKAAW